MKKIDIVREVHSSVALTGIHLTEEEYLELCDEDLKAELIGGVLIVSTPASVRHEQVQGFLQAILRAYVEAHGLGVVLGSRTPMRLRGQYFEPDILFVTQAHLERLGPVFLEGPADVVIEIASPESGALDRVVKRRAYGKHGVREYWLIDPERESAEFYILKAKGHYQQVAVGKEGVYRSRLISGFWLKLDWLWQEPLPPVLNVMHELGLI